ncbi:ComEC/Rec2 family competence protein [Halomicrococcus sp. SG-WS-1]|uniref:ComEC/Rec2 family competence protein n=1 Tax=Halomicrococcus sp. SG-WS-1 TaxID=3439057 RepID=UPI003F798836
MTETLEAHILNVGLGSSNLFVTPDNNVGVVDIGGPGLSKHLDKSATKYLRKYITRIIEGNSESQTIHQLFGTHSDKDHFGNQELLSQLPVDRVYFPTQLMAKPKVSRGIAEIMDEVREKGYVPSKLSKKVKSSIVDGSNASLYTVSPPGTPDTWVSKNDNSLCLILSYDDNDILFPADIERRGVGWVVESKKTKDIDCLVAPHHGSGTVNYGPLFDHCKPDYVFVSSAHKHHDGRYDHPTRTFLDEAKSHGCEVYWTAVHGHIVATTNGTDWKIKTQQNYSTNPDHIGDSVVSPSDLCNFDASTVPGYPHQF